MSAKEPYIREEINNDVLIREVELRAPLYNRNLGEYNELQLKLRLWEEIAEKLFPHTWSKLTMEQKERSVRDVQKRWKNIRACFTRELRHQRMYNNVGRRRKYIYYDKLLFLTSNIDQSDLRTEENETEDYRIEEEEFDREDTINIPINIPNGSSRKRRHDSPFMDVVHDAHNLDSDKNFALSIVPMLNAVPFRDKIEAQIAILKVLKKFVQCEESSKDVDYSDSIKVERLDDDDE